MSDCIIPSSTIAPFCAPDEVCGLEGSEVFVGGEVGGEVGGALGSVMSLASMIAEST